MRIALQSTWKCEICGTEKVSNDSGPPVGWIKATLYFNDNYLSREVYQVCNECQGLAKGTSEGYYQGLRSRLSHVLKNVWKDTKRKSATFWEDL